MDSIKFEDNKSYLVFKILADHFEEKTRLAINKLTLENIWDYKEINNTQKIHIPPISIKGIESFLACTIAKMRITEYLDEYGLNAKNEKDLKEQFLDYNKRMIKYYEYESEELDDFQDEDHFDNFGEPFYETD